MMYKQESMRDIPEESNLGKRLVLIGIRRKGEKEFKKIRDTNYIQEIKNYQEIRR